MSTPLTYREQLAAIRNAFSAPPNADAGQPTDRLETIQTKDVNPLFDHSTNEPASALDTIVPDVRVEADMVAPPEIVDYANAIIGAARSTVKCNDINTLVQAITAIEHEAGHYTGRKPAAVRKLTDAAIYSIATAVNALDAKEPALANAQLEIARQSLQQAAADAIEINSTPANPEALTESEKKMQNQASNAKLMVDACTTAVALVKMPVVVENPSMTDASYSQLAGDLLEHGMEPTAYLNHAALEGQKVAILMDASVDYEKAKKTLNRTVRDYNQKHSTDYVAFMCKTRVFGKYAAWVLDSRAQRNAMHELGYNWYI